MSTCYVGGPAHDILVHITNALVPLVNAHANVHSGATGLNFGVFCLSIYLVLKFLKPSVHI